MTPAYKDIWDGATPFCRWTVCIPVILLVYTVFIFILMVIPLLWVLAKVLPAVEAVARKLLRIFVQESPAPHVEPLT